MDISEISDWLGGHGDQPLFGCNAEPKKLAIDASDLHARWNRLAKDAASTLEALTERSTELSKAVERFHVEFASSRSSAALWLRSRRKARLAAWVGPDHQYTAVSPYITGWRPRIHCGET